MSLLQKVLKFDDVLIRLDTIPAYVLPTDRQTDGQTDRQTELVKQYRAPHALRNVARHEKNPYILHRLENIDEQQRQFHTIAH